MESVIIREVPKSSKVEILGHEFNGIAAIKDAVCRYSRMGYDGSIAVEPKRAVDGIYVLCVYMPYPCFDSDDYASENRDFSNYFFSTEPFSQAQVAKLSKLPGRCNAQIVSESMPVWAAPAVYYRGEGDKMVVAIVG